MPDTLSQETQQEIRRIVSGMVSNRASQNEAAEELRGHLEDKTLAYLNGDERLSEKDALVLAREHFGEPAALMAGLDEVQDTSPPVMSDRSLLAFCIVLFAMGSVEAGALASLRLLPHFLSVIPWILIASVPLGVWLQYILLRGWKRQLEKTGAVWFLQWPLSHLRSLFLLLFVTASLRELEAPLPLAGVYSQKQILLFMGVMLLGATLPFVLALWWHGANCAAGTRFEVLRKLVGVLWLNGLPGMIVGYIFLDHAPPPAIPISIFATAVVSFVTLAIPAVLALALYHFLDPKKKKPVFAQT